MSCSPDPSASGGAPAVFVDPTPVWQQRFRGLRWTDMPGGETELQKIHFALWRRGLVKVITDGAAPTGHRLGGRLLPGWGSGAADGEETTSALGQDVDTEMDVSEAADGEAGAVARTGRGGAHEMHANANVKGKAEAKGKVKPKARTPAGRAAARRRRSQMRLDGMCQQGGAEQPAGAGRGSRKMRRDLPGLLHLAERIRVAAEAAGLPIEEAARLGGITCGSLKPSQLARSGPKQRARMTALLEELVQRNHQKKEGA